jgi:hypothetical protein
MDRTDLGWSNGGGKMRHLKMLVPVVVMVAVAGFAFGAGTASATEACSKLESPCAAANMYGANQNFKGKLPAAAVAEFTGVLAFACNVSEFEGKLENTGGAEETLFVKLTKLTFAGCGGAAVVVVNKIPTLEIHTDNPEKVDGNGNVTGTEMTITVTVGLVKCEYAGPIKAGLTLQGGNPAGLIATKVTLSLERGAQMLCGQEIQWDGSYEITEPKPLFII